MPNQRLRLASFLLASGAIHALGFGMWRQEHVAPNEVALGEPLVTVMLASAQPAETKKKTGPISEQTTDGRRTTAGTAAASSPAQVRNIEASEPTDSEQRSHAHNALLGEIRTRLSQHLRYPPLAHHRGWQGEVLLGFAVGFDGRLSHIRVARSSGYDVLDKSALDSLQRVGQLTVDGLSLAAPISELRLPVIYRLTEN